MLKLSLPHHAADAWEEGFALDDGTCVTSIEARGGLVVAGGEIIHLLRPGGELWGGHAPPPYDTGPVRVVAAEPRGRRRYAAASQETFTVFVRHEDDRIEGLSTLAPGPRVTHLAWAGTEGTPVLHALREDNVLLRMTPDQSAFGQVEVEPLHALAADERGGLALVSRAGRRPFVYMVPDGVHWKRRPIEPAIDPQISVDIAVAGTAVAINVDEKYVVVSRAMGEPFVRIPALDLSDDENFWGVPCIAFQGPESDAALFAVRWERHVGRVVRVDASGEVMTLLELRGTEGRPMPEIMALSWDTSRQMLWGATSDAGIFWLAPPEAKGSKKVVLS